MRLPSSQSARWALVVALGALALVAINLWWVVTYRHGYPFNVDEAGYTTIGLVDYFGFKADGLSGWWDAVQAQAPVAPLVPAVTSLLLIVKTGVLEGFGTLIGFLVLLVFAVYGIGERLAGPRLGALAALVVGTSFGAFTFVREYIFAIPVAALLACAVFALLRSNGLRERRWAIACGAALGLMVLARTMAIAFVPGVFAAAVIAIALRYQDEIRTRIVNLVLMAVTAVLVAATWYARNIGPVWDYLTGFGYGEQSNYYGEENSAISWDRWSAVAERIVGDDLLVPLAALVFAGLVALLVVAVRRVVDSEDRKRTLLRLAGTDAFAVGIVFATGYIALTSSQNAGNGFTLPLSLLLPPLAVIALRYFRAATVPVVAATVAIAAINLAATSNIWDDLSRPRLVHVPTLGSLPWMNGTPHAVAAIRVQVPGPDARFVESDAGWLAADEALATLLMDQAGPDDELPVTAFASRHRAISSNSVQLAALAKFRRGIHFTQINAEPDDTVANYVRQLTAPEFSEPEVLVTMSRNTDDFDPLVSQGKAEAAARKVGFRKISETTLPDGRELRVWTLSPTARPAPGGRARGEAAQQR